MTQLSHLVTLGDSFVHGDGLANRDQAWPYLLGNRIGVDVVNLGLSGSGNDRIFRRLYEYFYEDLQFNNNPFYIVVFSSITRKEVWEEASQSYQIVLPHGSDPASLDYQNNFNLIHFYKQSILYKSAIRNLFKAYKIPYIFAHSIEALNSKEKREIGSIMNSQSPNHYDILKNDVNDVGWLESLVSHTPKTPCMHWNEDAHKLIAEFFYDTIHKNYGSINATFGEHLSHSNYVSSFEPWYNNN